MTCNATSTIIYLNVGTLVSPIEGLKQNENIYERSITCVGTLVSPIEGLKHHDVKGSVPYGRSRNACKPD